MTKTEDLKALEYFKRQAHSWRNYEEEKFYKVAIAAMEDASNRETEGYTGTTGATAASVATTSSTTDGDADALKIFDGGLFNGTYDFTLKQVEILRSALQNHATTDGDADRALEDFEQTLRFIELSNSKWQTCMADFFSKKSIDTIRTALQSTRIAPSIDELAGFIYKKDRPSMGSRELARIILENYGLNIQSTRKPPASDKCGNCSGDGWYTWGHPDMPEQKQCEECCGEGYIPLVPVDTININREVLQGVREALNRAMGCFDAAYIEGLNDRICEADEGDAGSLRGLLERRILYAPSAIGEALASLDAVLAEVE